VQDADHMARNLHRVPVLIVVCAELAQINATDKSLDRVGMVAGASVYPSVQNLILAARLEGLGTALTTLLCQYEPWMREQLSIPAGVAVAAVVALGYPAWPMPRRLSRLPVSELVFREQFGQRMFSGQSESSS
jgi:nitroreductase